MSDLQIEEATLEEAVAELSTLHDWLRWTTSQFASSSIFLDTEQITRGMKL